MVISVFPYLEATYLLQNLTVTKKEIDYLLSTSCPLLVGTLFFKGLPPFLLTFFGLLCFVFGFFFGLWLFDFESSGFVSCLL